MMTLITRWVIGGLALNLAMSSIVVGEQLTAGDHWRNVRVDRQTRHYRVHVPAVYKPGEPTPVVLAFHGGGSNAAEMAEFCGLDTDADRHGFIVVYPQGSGRRGRRTWNAGNCCGYAKRRRVDDVAFVTTVLDDLAAIVSVDLRRVFATGMSNGAMLVYRLADQLSTRIAAIAPVAGPMGAASCAPTRPVPLIHFHGTDDEFAPFLGGVGRKSLTRTRFQSVAKTIAMWSAVNRCSSTPVVTALADRAEDGMTVEQHVYTSMAVGADVVLVIVNGGGHTWPGRQPKRGYLGPSTADISANTMMWRFFERHPLPDSRRRPH